MGSGLKEPAEDLAEIDGRDHPDRGDDLPLIEELAWCLARFVEGSADEPTMQRSRRALSRCDRTIFDW